MVSNDWRNKIGGCRKSCVAERAINVHRKIGGVRRLYKRILMLIIFFFWGG